MLAASAAVFNRISYVSVRVCRPLAAIRCNKSLRSEPGICIIASQLPFFRANQVAVRQVKHAYTVYSVHRGQSYWGQAFCISKCCYVWGYSKQACCIPDPAC